MMTTNIVYAVHKRGVSRKLLQPDFQFEVCVVMIFHISDFCVMALHICRPYALSLVQTH
jgi:hypothetical protein